MNPPPASPFLGLPILTCATADFMAFVVDAARTRESPVTIGYLNAAQVNLAFESPEFSGSLRRLDARYADGQAVVWAARRRGAAVAERINAGDFTLEFFRSCAARGLRVGLIGGYAGDAERFAERFEKVAEGIQFCFKQDGFFKMDEAESAREALEAADPDVVLVGMGAPRQERLALDWSARGRPRVWWCVGALFEYYAGTRRRAPRWMRRMGLEWVFRLGMEPGRLWRRYLIGNPKFVWRMMRGLCIPDGGIENKE